MNLTNKKVLIVGCARSGLGAAKLALSQGAKVCVIDQKQRDLFNSEIISSIEKLEQQGVLFKLGSFDFVEEIDLVVVSPGVPLDMPLLQTYQTQGVTLTGEFEFASWFCKAPILAITGTNGKTTTTSLVGAIAKAYCKDTYIVGNIGRAFSEDVLEIPKTGIVVAEVSSFQLETAYSFTPNVAALLNITPDHLNRHKTMEAYTQAKYHIFSNQKEDQFAILNAKDASYKKAKEAVKSQLLTFDAEDKVQRGSYCLNNTLYVNIFGKCEKVCEVSELKVLGRHNIENILAAIAITRAFNIPLEVIQKVVKAFTGVEHRIEYVATKKGVDFYNDSKATNTGAAIPGLLAMTKPIRLIGGGMDKGSSFDEWVKLFKGRVEKLYLIGETKEQIQKAAHKKGFNHIECFETFDACVRAAYTEAKDGECVLLSPACASWDMFESYEQRGELFKALVNELEG